MNISTEHARPPAREVGRTLQLHEQMKVIGHRAVMIEPQTKTGRVTRQQKEQMAAIIVIAEDRLAVVSAVHDVVTRFIGPLLPTRVAQRNNSPSLRFAAHCCQPATYFTSKSRYINRLRTVTPPFQCHHLSCVGMPSWTHPRPAACPNTQSVEDGKEEGERAGVGLRLGR